MRDVTGANDTTEWRKLAQFMGASGGVSINSGAPKATA